MTARQRIEWIKCSEDAAYFIDSYVQIYDAVAERWLPFRLWPAQLHPLHVMRAARLSIHLKARQIGMTWLALAYALHKMLFNPIATVLLFSKRDDEAMELLRRLKDMYAKLPPWMQARAVTLSNEHEWQLSTGSRAMAFPTTAGDSYTASLVIGDEFDLVTNQDRMMASVKPTIDNGAQMILLSRPDKDRPLTRFKQIYRAAKNGLNDWTAVFLPWSAHPGRDRQWYEQIKSDIQSATGSLDELHEQYPETDTDALAPRTLNKRIAPGWIKQCYVEANPVCVVGEWGDEDGAPALPGLTIFCKPEAGRHYVMGADPAEGLPASDDSVVVVLDRDTGEECAVLAGKLEPKIVFPSAIDALGQYYNQAPILCERNNHGHAVIGWLELNGHVRVLPGFDGRPGWHSTTAGKVRMYDTGASVFQAGGTAVHSFATMTQLQSIEKDTLRAPEGLHDDRADSYVLALEAMSTPQGVYFA